METTQSMNWLRRVWRNTVPLGVRLRVGIVVGLLLNFVSRACPTCDWAIIKSTRERLARDRAFTEGLNDYLRRERDWLAQGGTFQAPENLPPGMFSDIDMAAIADLAKRVPVGGTIVDIGSLVGRSTTLWCRYSQAGRIVCIDPWEDHPWTMPLLTHDGSVKDNFIANVTDPRVEAIQGFSPECANNWNAPIDLYWEDGDHSNPTCAASIGFWSRYVKPGGIACGHDYHIPAVKAEARSLASRWNSELHLFGSVWWVRRPAP
jgi:predicted O-methyltransferase YrrM